MKNNADIIVVGAGAAGLAAARQLSRAGMRVIILEARSRLGGRIGTFRDKHFRFPTESGAEFIHGDQKLTMELLKEYGITYTAAKGKIVHLRKEELERDKDFVERFHFRLKRKLNALKRDTTVKKFLDNHFPGKKYEDLRNSVTKFVEGYSAADTALASAFAFRDEWLEAEEWNLYRVDGGYGALIHSLADDCRKNGCRIYHSSAVKKIEWKKNSVKIICRNKKTFSSARAVITVPLGVLRAGSIVFSPALPGKMRAIKKLGYGWIIKILLLFKTPFWKNKKVKLKLGEDLDELLFLFSDEIVPTWWTQHPSPQPLLTGWLSGPPSRERTHRRKNEILEETLGSLANIFKEDKKDLRKRLAAVKIINWNNDPFSLGSYNFTTAGSEKHINTLKKPEKDTLFFSGEITAPETGSGLVEAALASGFSAATKIILSGK